MAMAIFVSICGLLGVWLGIRYARWHKSISAERKNNRYPRNHRRMGDDRNVDE